MILERLLGNMAPAQFLEESFTKFPYSSPGGAAELTGHATWDTAKSILAQPDPDIIISRQGERWKDEARPDFPTVQQLYAQGYTLTIRDSQLHDPVLKELAAQFHQDFQAPTDVQLYFTPGDLHGFGWHYDCEDVFILQCSGVKEYSLRKNTVNPWPLKETLPANMRYEREVMPTMKCKLAAGDWLYIPNGYWHRADAIEDSISIAVGIQATSALDVFDFLRDRLLCSLLWRQRLPVLGDANDADDERLAEEFERIFSELGQDLKDAFADKTLLRDFFRSKGRELPSAPPARASHRPRRM